MNKLKRAISVVLVVACMLSCLIAGNISTHAAGNGIGLCNHVLKAYNNGWSYVYGGASPGAVDCSGLIWMYTGGNRTSMLSASSVNGYVSNGIPNIHGLGLFMPGHVGVYVGSGMAIDARGSQWGVCYQSVYTNRWTHWFKIAGVSYPTNGWEYFNGSYFYYKDGQYLTNTTVTVDGITYTLGKSGACTTTPANVDGIASSTGSSSSSSSSSSSNGNLQVGSYGDNVTKLQKRLTKLGFYSEDITGYFGELTEAALIRFQKAAGLTANGVANSSTTKVLYSDNAPYASTQNTTANNTSVTTPSESVTNTNDDTTPETTSPEATTPEEEENTSVTYTNGSFDDVVMKIQAELTTLGYFEDEATGYYGDVTESAVVAFQLENGLDTTGEVDEVTYETIFSQKALENPYVDDEKTAIEAPSTSTEPTTTVPATMSDSEADQIVLKSAEMAAKGLEGVDLQLDDVSSNSGSNSFIAWMIVMVIFMATAFWFVFSNEKKKKKARAERVKARANRKW